MVHLVSKQFSYSFSPKSSSIRLTVINYPLSIPFKSYCPLNCPTAVFTRTTFCCCLMLTFCAGNGSSGTGCGRLTDFLLFSFPSRSLQLISTPLIPKSTHLTTTLVQNVHPIGAQGNLGRVSINTAPALLQAASSSCPTELSRSHTLIKQSGF